MGGGGGRERDRERERERKREKEREREREREVWNFDKIIILYYIDMLQSHIHLLAKVKINIALKTKKLDSFYLKRITIS